MRIRPDPGYEAAFVRATDLDAPPPEELAAAATRRARRRKGLVAASIVGCVGVAVLVVYLVRRDTPEKQVQRGVAYSAAHSHVAAIIEFKRALQEQPDQPAVRVLLGKELSLMGDPTGAEIEFRKAAEAKYRPDETMPLLATSLLHQGRFEKVIALVADVKVDSPAANAELLSLRGASYYALGRVAEADDSWKAANEFVPGNPSTVLAQARARSARGQFAEADALLDRIAADAPKTELLTLRGEIARALGKPLDAVAIYQEALKGEPGNLFVREKLAETLVDLKRFDEAADQVKRILAPMPNDANAHFVKALIAIGRGDLAGADESAGTAVQLVPTDGRFQLLAGTIALQRGRRADAEQHLRDAVTLLPQNVDARRLLARIYVDRHDAARAEETFRPVFFAAPGDPENARIVARIALLKDNPVAAARAFDHIDPSIPTNADATMVAASLQMAAGDRAGGLARLRTAQAASPNNADIDAALVKAYLTYNELRDAQAAWTVLARKEATSARTLSLAGGIELARGDRAAARRSLQRAVEADPHALAPVSGLAMIDLRDRKPDDATARLRAFVAANPSDVDAILLLVKVDKPAGADGEAVVALLQGALKADPQSLPVRYALVGRLVERGDAESAATIADEGLVDVPNDPVLLAVVGDRALDVGDSDRAIAVFKRLVDANAASADYAVGLGLAQLAAGNGEETLTAFRLALSRDPGNVERQETMVGALLAAGRADEASRMLYEVRRMSPRSPVIAELDADVKLGLRQYPEANAAYKKALAQSPSPRLVAKTYSALMTALQRGEATAFLDEWLRAHPADEASRRFDADVASTSGDHARAAADFRVLAAAHPADAHVLNDLAWQLGLAGDAQAVAIAEKAHALAPNDPAVADTLGWLLVERGDAVRGLPLIERASAAAPKELDIRLHLGRALLKAGRPDAARATLQALAEAAPSTAQGRASRTLLATF